MATKQQQQQKPPADQPADTKPADADQPATAELEQPAVEATGDPDPEWLALLDRARAGGDDAAGALIDAYSRGIAKGVERSEAVRSEGGRASITTADTAALRGVSVGTAPARPRRILISQGVADDLKRLGKVTDPGTGYELRRDADTGSVTVHDRRTGEQVDIPTS